MIVPRLLDLERKKRLLPPQGKVNMVLDTDTFNEVDDQFALAYALMSPEKLNVQAVYAAPFSSSFFTKLLGKENVNIPMTSDLKEGLDLSYQEILKIYSMIGQSADGKVFKGSDAYLSAKDTPVHSDAAHDLVERAMASDELLYVVAIGEITNIASAIMIEPKIIEKIVVVWLAGQPMQWPQTIEFNLGQDVIASQFIFDCGVPLVLIPCMTVASHLTTTSGELNEFLNGKSKIGTYLTETVTSQFSPEASRAFMDVIRFTYLQGVDDYDEALVKRPLGKFACSRIIWDISAIGYVLNPNWCPSKLMPAPRLTSELTWEHDADRHDIRVCQYVFRDPIFGDMFDKLSQCD